MNHLTMDFTNIGSRRALADAAATGQSYSIKCINQSSVPWIFYVYQTMPNQPSQVFSTAWFASPYMIGTGGSSITFTWNINYCFVWGITGTVAPGVTFSAGGQIPCDPSVNNYTTFSMLNNTPSLSQAAPGPQSGSLIISEDSSIPNSIFATGIGMSGYGTFVQQALAYTMQAYTPKPQYWIAAATQIQMGEILPQIVSMTAEFDPNGDDITATLGQNNLWSISYK